MAVARAGAAALFFEIAVKSIRVFMPNLPIHPATRLVAWLALLVAVQFLSGMMLTIACLLTPFLGARVLRRGGHLIWRTRWLLLSLFVIFSWGVAGEPLWNGALPPTLEGLQEAAKHLGRMLLVLLAVAAFLEYMPLSDLLAATHTLFFPLRRFGLDSDRGVVRLMLVLRYVETLPRPRDWKTLLDAPEPGASEIVELDRRPLGWGDGLVVAGLLGLAAFYCLR